MCCIDIWHYLLHNQSFPNLFLQRSCKCLIEPQLSGVSFCTRKIEDGRKIDEEENADEGKTLDYEKNMGGKKMYMSRRVRMTREIESEKYRDSKKDKYND